MGSFSLVGQTMKDHGKPQVGSWFFCLSDVNVLCLCCSFFEDNMWGWGTFQVRKVLERTATFQGFV